MPVDDGFSSAGIKDSYYDRPVEPLSAEWTREPDSDDERHVLSAPNDHGTVILYGDRIYADMLMEAAARVAAPSGITVEQNGDQFFVTIDGQQGRGPTVAAAALAASERALGIAFRQTGQRRVAAPSDGLDPYSVGWNAAMDHAAHIADSLAASATLNAQEMTGDELRAALATTGQREPCQPKSDDRWLCDVHGGYFGGRTSGGSRCSAAQPEDTRTADPGGLRERIEGLTKFQMVDWPGQDFVLYEDVAALTPEATAPGRFDHPNLGAVSVRESIPEATAPDTRDACDDCRPHGHNRCDTCYSCAALNDKGSI